jgi:hypothetical protein
VGGISILVFNTNLAESAAHILPRAVLRIGLYRAGIIYLSKLLLWFIFVVTSQRKASDDAVIRLQYLRNKNQKEKLEWHSCRVIRKELFNVFNRTGPLTHILFSAQSRAQVPSSCRSSCRS